MKQGAYWAAPLLCVAVANTVTAGAPAPAPPMTMQMATPIPRTLNEWARGAQLFEGLSLFHRRVSTASPTAQAYFDQGMRLIWVFNHDEATRSFAKALKLDPQCAMCAWGVALSVGPNYNLSMLAAPRAVIAFQATQRAQRLARTGSRVEQALIAALAHRYPDAQALDPQTAEPVLIDFANAMRKVARRFPEDLDVQTLFAESLMNVRAWRLWNPDGTPAQDTPEILKTLEGVIARDPGHMGALHYYVHSIEASPTPEKGIVAAERLRGLAPAAGHLQHMPAHIFHRVGRYEDSSQANRDGAAADLAYLAMTTPPDYYTMYVGHNFQFLAYSTAAEGREAETLEAVQKSRASLSDALLKEMPGADWYVAEMYAADVRFGRWDALLAQAAPDPDLPGLLGGYLYATAIALAAKNRPAEAHARLVQLQTLIEALPADAPAGAGQNTLRATLTVGMRLAQSRIAAAEGRTDDELQDLRGAVALEDALIYDEPSEWFFPVRHVLGAALLRVGQPAQAERVYREDLQRHPDNGWALFGLARSLQLLGRPEEADVAQAQFRKAWAHATISITASAF